MKVKKINATPTEAIQIPALLDKEGVDFHPINHVNWKEYPYCPDVQFRIAYCDEGLLLHYKVNEESVRAKYTTDNDPVWTDSCVEFFSIPAADGVYYNMEFNCIGTILIGAGAERKGRTRAQQDITHLVKRWSSLGRLPFEERSGGVDWELALLIPYRAYFLHQIASLEGQTILANFYKCGDELSTPHFVSWSPIVTDKPYFHCPEYFGALEF